MTALFGALAFFLVGHRVLTRRSGDALALLLLVGALQGPITALSRESTALYIDDLAFVPIGTAAFLALLRGNRLSRSARHVGLIACTLVLVAILRGADPQLSLLQGRQLLIPILLVVFGLSYPEALRSASLRRTVNFTVGLAAAVAAFELVGYRPIDPTTFSETGMRSGGIVRDGLPAYYFTYWGDATIERTGSIFLNPPEASIFFAAALSYLLIFLRPSLARYALIASSSIALLATVGRAGFLLVGLTAGFYIARRRSHVWGMILVATPVVIFLYRLMAASGNTRRHAEGLLEGLRIALATGIGKGMGAIGNATVTINQQGVGESLLGIAFASLGIPVLVLSLFVLRHSYRTSLMARHASSSARSRGVALAYLPVAALVLAAFSESASSLAATALLWPMVGAALNWQPEQRLAESPPPVRPI